MTNLVSNGAFAVEAHPDATTIQYDETELSCVQTLEVSGGTEEREAAR